MNFKGLIQLRIRNNYTFHILMASLLIYQAYGKHAILSLQLKGPMFSLDSWKKSSIAGDEAAARRARIFNYTYTTTYFLSFFVISSQLSSMLSISQLLFGHHLWQCHPSKYLLTHLLTFIHLLYFAKKLWFTFYFASKVLQTRFSL